MCSTRALISCTYFFHPSKTRKVIQENAKLHTKYLKNTWFCKVFCVEKMSTTLSLALFDEHFMHFISGKWHETSATTPLLEHSFLHKNAEENKSFFSTFRFCFDYFQLAHVAWVGACFDECLSSLLSAETLFSTLGLSPTSTFTFK